MGFHEVDSITRIKTEELMLDLVEFAGSIPNRKQLDAAIAYFEKAGIKDGYGVMDWLIFDGGLIDEFQPSADHMDVYESVRGAKLTIYESSGGVLRDILGPANAAEEIKAGIEEEGLIACRVFHGSLVLEYDRIESFGAAKVAELLKTEEDLTLGIRKLGKAANFDIPEDCMLYQAMYKIVKDPVEVFMQRGYDVFDEDGIYSVFDADSCIAELEIQGSTLFVLCNSPVDLEKVTSGIDDEQLVLIRKEVISVEELLASDFSS